MDRAADIEIGEMEKHLGTWVLLIAPTLGFIGTISGVINILQHFSNREYQYR
jgi:biopolymer transport protein ExbB